MAGFHWIAIPLCVLALGCPTSDDAVDEASGSETTDATSTTASTSATTTSASSTTEMTSASTSASSDPTMSTSDDTTSIGTSESGTDTGAVGCDACDVGEYCDWPVNGCGTERFDEPVCTAIPDGCPAVEEDPVCGCDGIVYSGTCAAALLGVDIDATGQCDAPQGLFECGYAFCDPTTSYCQWSVSDVGGYPDSWGCGVLPESCGDTPTCECLADEPCGFACETTADGGLLLTCPGG